MRTKLIILSTTAFLSIVFAGCGGPTTNSNTATNTANANSDPTATNKATPEQVVNDAPTLTPVFKAYCQAWQKNDEAALRKVYSADTLKQFQEGMKEEKAKNLLKFLEADKITGTPCEIKNEKITGDTAVATVTTNKAPMGNFQIVFVKENGEWKLTNKSPTFDAVTKQAPPAAASPAK